MMHPICVYEFRSGAPQLYNFINFINFNFINFINFNFIYFTNFINFNSTNFSFSTSLIFLLNHQSSSLSSPLKISIPSSNIISPNPLHNSPTSPTSHTFQKFPLIQSLSLIITARSALLSNLFIYLLYRSMFF